MMYKVEQIDRQAASHTQRELWGLSSGFAKMIESGALDHGVLVQAFAKHRLQALGEVK